MSIKLQKNIVQQVRDKSGTTISEFAKRNKVSRKCVYDSLEGAGVRRIRIAIAKTLELPPSVIWPDNHPCKRVVDDMYYMGIAHG